LTSVGNLAKIRCDGGEAKWSHLLDLRERLAAAGLDAAELVGDTITEKGLVTRARARVRGFSSDRPSGRLVERRQPLGGSAGSHAEAAAGRAC